MLKTSVRTWLASINTAFPLLCPQNGGVIAEPPRDDSWSVQHFTPATAPCSFPGTKTIQVSVLTLKRNGLYQINGQTCAVALCSSLVLRYCYLSGFV